MGILLYRMTTYSDMAIWRFGTNTRPNSWNFSHAFTVEGQIIFPHHTIFNNVLGYEAPVFSLFV